MVEKEDKDSLIVLRVEDVAKNYIGHGRSEPYAAIESVSFNVFRGEIVCVVGKTGCGKSTLVNLILGLDEPSRGTIRVSDKAPDLDFMQLRGEIAAVFQTDRLLPWLNIIDNTALGLEAANMDKRERRLRAKGWLEQLGLRDWLEAFPYQLSGGMRQRAAIARAFVVDPELLILDEAFGHLDEVTAESLRHDFLKLVRDSSTASVVVTHDIREAIEIADRIIILGRPATVLETVDVRSLRTPHKGAGSEELWKEETKLRIFDLIGAS